jgi:hypothetical protein
MTHKVGMNSDNGPTPTSCFDIVRLEHVKTTEADEDEAFYKYVDFVGAVSEEVRP